MDLYSKQTNFKAIFKLNIVDGPPPLPPMGYFTHYDFLNGELPNKSLHQNIDNLTIYCPLKCWFSSLAFFGGEGVLFVGQKTSQQYIWFFGISIPSSFSEKKSP